MRLQGGQAGGPAIQVPPGGQGLHPEGWHRLSRDFRASCANRLTSRNLCDRSGPRSRARPSRRRYGVPARRAQGGHLHAAAAWVRFGGVPEQGVPPQEELVRAEAGAARLQQEVERRAGVARLQAGQLRPVRADADASAHGGRRGRPRRLTGCCHRYVRRRQPHRGLARGGGQGEGGHQKVFTIKELGAAKKLNGIEVRRDRAHRIIHLSQRKKIEELLERTKMADSHPVSTPMDQGTRLTDMMCAKTDEEKRDMEKVPYSSVVGSLLYLSTGTRPDIAYAVGEVSRFMKNPGRGHWTAVKHLLRYLKGTVDWGIQFGGPGADLTVQGYSDADWGGAQDRRSTTGYVFMLAGGPVSWRSKRQKSVALSTMEAEYMSLCDAAQEAIWMARLVVDLIGQAAVPKAIVIHEDNQGCR